MYIYSQGQSTGSLQQICSRISSAPCPNVDENHAGSSFTILKTWQQGLERGSSIETINEHSTDKAFLQIQISKKSCNIALNDMSVPTTFGPDCRY